MVGRPPQVTTELSEAVEDALALFDEFLEGLQMDFQARLRAKYADYPHWIDSPSSPARRSA